MHKKQELKVHVWKSRAGSQVSFISHSYLGNCSIHSFCSQETRDLFSEGTGSNTLRNLETSDIVEGGVKHMTENEGIKYKSTYGMARTSQPTPNSKISAGRLKGLYH